MIGGDHKKERFSERLTMAQSQPKNRGYLPGTQQRGKYGYSSATLLGNWMEEVYDATFHNPNEAVLRHSSKRNINWTTTYQDTIGKAAASHTASTSHVQENTPTLRTSQTKNTTVVPQQVMLALEDHTKCSYPGDQSLYYQSQETEKLNKKRNEAHENSVGYKKCSPSLTALHADNNDVNTKEQFNTMLTTTQLCYQPPELIKAQPAWTLQPSVGHSSTAQANGILRRVRHELQTKCHALRSSFPGNLMSIVRSTLHEACTTKYKNEINVHELVEAFAHLNTILHDMNNSASGITANVQVNEAECSALIRAYDHHGTQTARVEELVHAIRGAMSDRRTPVIESVYALLEEVAGNYEYDSDNDDELVRLGMILNLIDLRPLCIKKSFEFSDSTETITGKDSNIDDDEAEEILKQACKDYTHQWACLLYHTSTNDLDRRNLADSFTHLYIDRTTFINFFSDASFEIISDTQFERFMRNLWHLSGGNGNCANTSCTVLEVIHTNGRVTRQTLYNDLLYYQEILNCTLNGAALSSQVDNFILDNLYRQNVKDIKSYRVLL